MKLSKHTSALAATFLLAAGGVLVACTVDGGQEPVSQNQSTSHESEAANVNPKSQSVESKMNASARGVPVTSTQAGRIATEEFGGIVKEVGSNDDEGMDSWEIEIRDSREGRIFVKVEKSTGKILHMEQVY